MSDNTTEPSASGEGLTAALINLRLAILRRIVAQQELYASDSMIRSALQERSFSEAIEIVRAAQERSFSEATEVVRAVQPGIWQRMLSPFRLGWWR